MNNRFSILLLFTVIIFVASIVFLPRYCSAQDIPRISIEQVKRKLGTDNFVIIDSRTGSDWSGSEFKIKGAIRGKIGQENEWSKGIHKDAEIVVYCA
nr:rhodanese-like domain-containing protein [Maridesulfovibrio zosterae]